MCENTSKTGMERHLHRSQLVSWCQTTFSKSILVGDDKYTSIIEKNGVKSFLYHPDMDVIQSVIKETNESKKGDFSIKNIYDIGIFDDECVFLPKALPENKNKRNTWYKYNIMDVVFTKRKDGVTPLVVACYHGLPQIVTLLLSVLDHPANVQTEDGTSAVMETIASTAQDTEDRLLCLEQLLKHGASVTTKNKFGHNAVTLSCFNGTKEYLKLLDSSNCKLNWNHQTALGHTPLMFAVYGDNLEVVEYLVNEKRVSPTKQNYNHLTALDLSLLLNSRPCIKGLLAMHFFFHGSLGNHIKRRLSQLQTDQQSEQVQNRMNILFIALLFTMTYLGRFRPVRNAALDAGILDFIMDYFVWRDVSLHIRSELCLSLAAHLFYDNDRKGMARLMETQWAESLFTQESQNVENVDTFLLDRFMASISFFLCAENGFQWICDTFMKHPKLGLKLADFDLANEAFVAGFFEEILKILTEYNNEEGFSLYKAPQGKNKTKKLLEGEENLRIRISDLVPARNEIILFLQEKKPEMEIMLIEKVEEKLEKATSNKNSPNKKNGKKSKIVSKIKKLDTFEDDDCFETFVSKKELRKIKKENKKVHLEQLKSYRVDQIEQKEQIEIFIKSMGEQPMLDTCETVEEDPNPIAEERKIIKKKRTPKKKHRNKVSVPVGHPEFQKKDPQPESKTEKSYLEEEKESLYEDVKKEESTNLVVVAATNNKTQFDHRWEYEQSFIRACENEIKETGSGIKETGSGDKQGMRTQMNEKPVATTRLKSNSDIYSHIYNNGSLPNGNISDKNVLPYNVENTRTINSHTQWNWDEMRRNRNNGECKASLSHQQLHNFADRTHSFNHLEGHGMTSVKQTKLDQYFSNQGNENFNGFPGYSAYNVQRWENKKEPVHWDTGKQQNSSDLQNLNPKFSHAMYFDDPAIINVAVPVIPQMPNQQSQQTKNVKPLSRSSELLIGSESPPNSNNPFPSAYDPLPNMLLSYVDKSFKQASDTSKETTSLKKSSNSSLIQEQNIVTTRKASDNSLSKESGYMSPTFSPMSNIDVPMFVKNWGQGSSIRWRAMLKQLVQTPVNDVKRVGTINFLDGDTYISKGSCGTVVRAGVRDDGMEVAVKCLVKVYTALIYNEIKNLRELQHPNVIQYKDYVEDANFAYVALELCEYTLDEYVFLLAKTREIDLHSQRLCHQLMSGLKALHDAKVLHMDLKPRNVLIDLKGNLRLADFGLSHRLKEEQNTFYHSSIHGTKCWRAPETLRVPHSTENENSGRYKQCTDIYVSGMILYFIVTGGKHPFGEDSALCEVNILNGCAPNTSILRDEVFGDVFVAMLNPDMDQRISTNHCIAHPFFWDSQKRFEFLVCVGCNSEVAARVSNKLVKQIELLLMTRETTSQWIHEYPQEVISHMGWQGMKLNSVLDILTIVVPEMDERLQQEPNSLEQILGCETPAFIMRSFPGLFMTVYEAVVEVGWQKRHGLREFFKQTNPVQ